MSELKKCFGGNEDEDLLSPELRAELGESNDIIIIGRKDKRDREKQREDKANESLIEEAKQLSKKAKKKLILIEEKKEKEKKRDSYYEVLKQNEISNEHRQLLSNTREASTMKNILKKILKKYQAGLTLTNDERNLLFPNGDDQIEETIQPSNINSIKKSNIISCYNDNNDNINNNNNNNLLFDMNDLYEPSDKRKDENTDKKKKKKKKQKHDDKVDINVDDTKTEKTNKSNSSIGSQLMLQFQKLKENNILKSDNKEKISEIVNTNNVNDTTTTNTTIIPDNKNTFILMTQTKRIALTGMKEEEKFIAKQDHLPINNIGQLKVKESKKNSNKKIINTKFLMINRSEELRAARMLLPVCGMEQEIVEKITENDVVILCGETGSGKSTQVPQFLYEAGFGYDGIIGITQPRRVAAVSTASRVAFELGTTCEEGKTGIVGYQIRFDSSTVGSETAIKFMTDGVLLREITTDFILRKYSAIILDEAHERNTNTDVLLGMLSRSIHTRRAQSLEEMEKWNKLTESEKEEYEKPIKPLKLIIMSATMRIEDFQNPILFKTPPPIIRVEARQHPVDTHFSKRTELNDYLNEVHKKVCQIHRKLPDGGVLVFLTGKREILHMVSKLSKALNGKTKKIIHTNSKNDNDDDDDNEVNIRCIDDDDDDDDIDNNDDDTSSETSEISYEEEKQDINNSNNDIENDEEKIDEDAQMQRDRMLREALGFDFDEKIKEIESKKENEVEQEEDTAPPKKAYILPLYAMMPASEQRKVFEPPPPDSRLIVIATNVAETSITIPGIRYVVDCGRQKERVYDNSSGISKFEVKWVSKAAAEQRKGRAGRTGPGHCYRLFSSAFFDQHMSLYQVPEISRIPLDELVLSMRSMGIVEIENFPFPTQPPKVSLIRSIRLLEDLGAISRQRQSSLTTIVDTTRSNNGKNLTALGQLLAKFPINPRYSRMLIMSKQLGVIKHALSLVAILSEKSPFLDKISNSKKRKQNDSDNDDEGDDNYNDNEDKNLELWFHPDGDAMARLRALGAYIFTCNDSKKKQKNGNDNTDIIRRFCTIHNMHQATLERSFQIRQQIASLCPKLFNDIDNNNNNNSNEYEISSLPPTKEEEISLRQVLTSGSCDRIAKKVPINVIKSGSRRKRLTAYYSCNSQITEPIYIHPSSALYRNNPSDSMPEYVTYNQLISNEEGDTTYMTCVTAITPTWIPSLLLDCSYLRWGPPLESPHPFYDLNEDCVACYVIPKYGVHKWELPPVKRDLNELCNNYDNDDVDNNNDNDNNEKYISKPLGYRKKDEAYRWFGRLLLEGSIGLDLKGALRNDKLKESSNILTKQIPNVKAASLLRLLVLNKIITKTKLLTKLKEDPLFLCEEIQQFISTENRKEFRKAWSTLI